MTVVGPLRPLRLAAGRHHVPAPARVVPVRPDPSVLAASLEESVHGFAIVTPERDGPDRFLWANPTFLGAVRRAEAEVVGAPLDDVLPGAVVGSSARCTLDDGRRVVAHVRLLRDERGRPLFALLELDLSTDGAAAHDAEDPGEPQGATNELDHVTSVIAHDLRQPLAAIAGFAHHLQRHAPAGDDADARSLADDIVQGCAEITTILDNAMAYVQPPPEPGTLTLVGAAGAVKAAWWNVQALAQERGGRIEVQRLPLLAFDPVQLRQVFQNLLANAITYVDPGVTPSIVVSATRGPARWVISVEDNGVGMPAHEPPSRHRRSDAGPRHQRHGSGLGLLICQRIVRRHSGRLWVEPGPAGGSIVRFDVPDPVGEGN